MDHSSKASGHRLAAVMFTDIVGYTAMMGRNEESALELLRKNRQIQKPLIEKYDGLLIKEMGDGILARFDSAYDAVCCAISIQETVRKDFNGRLRIGLHIGDIYIEDNDIFGDGVNVASRIESIADPGSIYLSGEFYKSIQNHTDIKTRYLAKAELKNVIDPVAIYCVVNPGIATPSKEKVNALKAQGKEKSPLNRRFFKNPLFYLLLIILLGAILTNKYWFGVRQERTIQAIAVLPFTNLTGSETEQYFVDMMHDAVITEISQIGDLIVKSRTSTLQFKNSTTPIPEIARILNVDAVIESTVAKSGDSVYMNVQLIKARPEEDHIWASDFIRGINQIFTLYGELANTIAREVEIQLSPEEKSLLTHTQEIDPRAYEAYMKGKFHWYFLSKTGLDSAEYYYNLSIDIDPGNALAYAGLASVSLVRAQNGLTPFYESALTGIKFLEKAQDLDSAHSEIHFLEASFNTWGTWEFEKAKAEFEKAISMNPNHALLRVYYAHLLCYYKNFNEAIVQAEYALRLDPLNNLVKGIYGMTMNNCRRYEQADSIFNVVLETEPYNAISLSNLKTTYHMQKKYEEAYELWKIDHRNDPEALVAMDRGYKKGGYLQALENLADLMVERSKTAFITPWRICTLYTRAGLKDSAIDYLEKAYDVHDQNMPYIISDPIFDYMRDDPRFQVIVDKMNFPE
jgi:adenylate cyclase